MMIRHSVSIAVLILSTQTAVMPRNAVAQNNSTRHWFYCLSSAPSGKNYFSEVFSAEGGSAELEARFKSFISQRYGSSEATGGTECIGNLSNNENYAGVELKQRVDGVGTVPGVTVVQTGWPDHVSQDKEDRKKTAEKPDNKKKGCDDPPTFTSFVEVEDGGTAADQAYAGTSYCMAYVSSRSAYPLECHLRGRNMTLYPGHEKDLFEGWPLADGEKCEAHIVCTKDERFPKQMKLYCP